MSYRTVIRNGEEVRVDFASGKADQCPCGNPYSATCDYPKCASKLCEYCAIEGMTEGVHFCDTHYPLARAAYERKLAKEQTKVLPLFDNNLGKDGKPLTLAEKRGRAIWAMQLVEMRSEILFAVFAPTIADKSQTFYVKLDAQGTKLMRCDCGQESCEHIFAVTYFIDQKEF